MADDDVADMLRELGKMLFDATDQRFDIRWDELSRHNTIEIIRLIRTLCGMLKL